jgi:hypothetical protein
MVEFRTNDEPSVSYNPDAPVLAAASYRSNAELIEACARLGYIRTSDRVLDPTYGRGVWWKNWRPDDVTAYDINIDGVDFRHLPHEDQDFDVVAFDPPYVSIGGRRGSTLTPMHSRFGMNETPETPVQLQALINDGLTECARVTRRLVLVKCQDYISSGRYFPGTYHVQHQAFALGLETVDRLERIGPPRPQPSVSPNGRPRTQRHARRNISTLLVFRK